MGGAGVRDGRDPCSVSRMHFGSVPFLATRIRGDVAWITWLYVPPHLRHHGLGRRMVEAWERQVPPDVRQIRLVPAEIDGVDPVPFWERLGFHDDAESARGDVGCPPVMSREVPRDS